MDNVSEWLIDSTLGALIYQKYDVSKLMRFSGSRRGTFIKREKRACYNVCCDYVDDYDDYENGAKLLKNTEMFFPTLKTEKGLI